MDKVDRLEDLDPDIAEDLVEFCKQFKDGNIKQPFQFKKANDFKIGRNESCPCGSGKKYKKCCMR